ncbi:MAG TPA: NYN domain-containing protein [Bacteroidota bacterium]|nr:NYN domain-containing protein [Bacteroidota bacterium]
MEQERVITYIDGFNLYFGLKAARWKRFYWLNLQLLSQNLLKPHQTLVTTKYFTSRVSYPPDKQRRQSTFIEALETLSDFKIYYGQYQANPRRCNKCGNKELVPQEKMTDVNIAVEMLSDAYENLCDTAVLISADSDLTAPILAIKKLFPDKRVIVAFPPQRNSWTLQRFAHATLSIGRANLAKSIFPDVIQKADGYMLHRPEEWK